LIVFTGELVYALAPTVPPWMAANHFGLMPELTRFNAILFNFAIPDLTSGFDTNPIAAMPSLHAGFPILCCLLLWGLYRWKATPFYVYTAAVLFAIVYSGDHYVVDVLAGLVLAVVCYLVAAGRRKPALEAAVPDGDSLGALALKKRLLAGLAVFLAGVAIGGMNKTQFVLHANSYGLDVPRYVDFFRDEGRYKDNYSVQLYFGNHYLSRDDPARALPCLERSLALARNPVETQEAKMRVAFCRQVLGRRK
jgi:hypothetical protein